MRRTMTALLLSLCWAAGALAQYPSLNDGFVVLRASSSTNVFFDCDLPTGNTDFTNSITYIYAGENLFLGGEVKTPRGTCNSSEAAVDVVTLQYALDGGPTNSLNLPRISAGSPDQWQEASATGMVEIARQLPVGLHTVDVFFVGVDVNFCLGGGLSGRLPGTGAYRGVIDVRAGAPDVRACDEAGGLAYSGGWTNGANGGYGFGPWTTLVSVVGDGDAAGFFLGTNPPNADLNFVASRGRAWSMYANEGGGTGDDLQISAAFRSLPAPLSAGQSFTVEFEHGGIQGGSLSDNNPPRTGGWVGFALRSSLPVLFGDPDPFDAFGIIQHAQVAVGFRGGQANYQVYDLISPSGRDSGLPYTADGARAVLTMTGADTYALTLTTLGTNGTSVKLTGQTGGGSLAVAGLYDRNAEENDVHFNRLAVLAPPTTNRAARDDADDAAYATGWATNSNGGFGFQEWLLAAFPGAGSAGFFLATNPPNTDVNGIASFGRAWGMYANDIPNPGVQSVTAYRYFAQGALQAGQTFGLSLEHGGIAPVGGIVEIALIGTPTFVNQQGEVLYFRFPGGAAGYTLTDQASQFDTGIPFTADGMRLDFQLLDSGSPARYVLTVDTRGANGGVYRFCGQVESAPKALRFRITDVELNDVFLNRLYIVGLSGTDPDSDGMPTNWEQANGLNPDVNDAGDDADVDGSLNIEEFVAGTNPQSSNSIFRAEGVSVTGPAGVSIGSVTGRLYTLLSTTDLVVGAWADVAGQQNVPGTGVPLVLTNGVRGTEHFRVRVQMAP